MVIGYLNRKKVLLLLLKDFSSTHTITSLSRELGFTRVGMWKIIKGLEKQEYIALKAVGKGRTSTGIAALNWENALLGKTLSLHLAEEAMRQKRWQVNFGELERFVDFAILYGSIIISPNKKQPLMLLALCFIHFRLGKAVEDFRIHCFTPFKNITKFSCPKRMTPFLIASINALFGLPSSALNSPSVNCREWIFFA